MTRHRFAAEGMALSRLYYVWILPRLVACVVARYFNDNDVVDAVSGGNIVYGGAGNDLLCGDDTVLGGAGDDQIQSNEARHTNYVRNTRPVGNIPVWKRQSRRFESVVHPLVAGLLAAIALTGCGEKYVPPDVHFKSDPGEKYNIRLELDSPSIQQSASVAGFAEYDVSNFKDCVVRRVGIGPDQPLKQVPVEVKRYSERIFITGVYKNPLVNDDYYGLGICKWELRAVFIISDGVYGKTTFSFSRVGLGSSGVVCNKGMSLCVQERRISNSLPDTRTPVGRAIITGE